MSLCILHRSLAYFWIDVRRASAAKLVVPLAQAIGSNITALHGTTLNVMCEMSTERLYVTQTPWSCRCCKSFINFTLWSQQSEQDTALQVVYLCERPQKHMNLQNCGPKLALTGPLSVSRVYSKGVWSMESCPSRLLKHIPWNNLSITCCSKPES